MLSGTTAAHEVRGVGVGNPVWLQRGGGGGYPVWLLTLWVVLALYCCGAEPSAVSSSRITIFTLSTWSSFVPDQCWWSWDVGQFQAPSRSATDDDRLITCTHPQALPIIWDHYLPLQDGEVHCSACDWRKALIFYWDIYVYYDMNFTTLYLPMFKAMAKRHLEQSKGRWPWL